MGTVKQTITGLLCSVHAWCYWAPCRLLRLGFYVWVREYVCFDDLRCMAPYHILAPRVCVFWYTRVHASNIRDHSAQFTPDASGIHTIYQLQEYACFDDLTCMALISETIISHVIIPLSHAYISTLSLAPKKNHMIFFFL